MTKFCSVSLVALALAMNAGPSQARPTDKAMTDARARLTQKTTESRYMRLDTPTMNTCPTRADGGENRFDRMYDSIDTSICYTGP